MTEFKCKYLFTVGFSDGTTYQQNPEDVSLTDPDKSCFFDVLKREDEIDWFVLKDADDNGVGVDLRDGHFEINGNIFMVGDDDQHFTSDTKLRLVFFRRHRHEFNLGYEELSHSVGYFLGWQTTIGGKNYKQIIGVG